MEAERTLINAPKIDLACGNNKKEGFVGIDIAETPLVDYVVDLQVFPWPIESESVEELYCGHYIEHIPHSNFEAYCIKATAESNSWQEYQNKIKEYPSKDCFIQFINEVYRILKPGGKAKLVAPYYTSERAYGDPTHVRAIADSTVWYFNNTWIKDNKLEHYGINCNFDVVLSYYITNEMTLKSEEVRQKAFSHDWNVIQDLIIDLVKK
jgi:predicted SAM-dependent methyltransferase